MSTSLLTLTPAETGMRPLTKNWCAARDGDMHALAMYERHYSAHRYADGRVRKLFCGPGEKMVLLASDGCALWVWRKFRDDSGQQGINCAVFRNEGVTRSSVLIREAMDAAWSRWPGERLYTYVNPRAIKSANPGYCFKQAGWTLCGVTKWNRLLILECAP